MSSNLPCLENGVGGSLEKVTYLQDMVGELLRVARSENAGMLVYLLEMAFSEASELASRLRLNAEIDRYHSARVAIKPSGEI